MKVKRVLVASLVATLIGCDGTETDRVPAVAPTPQSQEALALTADQLKIVMPILESLANAIAQIAPKYAELSRFRTEQAIHRSGMGIGLIYDYNFTMPSVKRGVLPTDVGKNGLHVAFSFGPMPPPSGPGYAMSPPSQELRNLRLYLWEEVLAAPDTTKEGVEAIRTILKTHSDKMVEIDKKSR